MTREWDDQPAYEPHDTLADRESAAEWIAAIRQLLEQKPRRYPPLRRHK